MINRMTHPLMLALLVVSTHCSANAEGVTIKTSPCPVNSLAGKKIMIHFSTIGVMASMMYQAKQLYEAAGAMVSIYPKPAAEGKMTLYRVFYWPGSTSDTAIKAQNCLKDLYTFNESSPSDQTQSITPDWGKYDAIVYLIEQ
jgi:hypothetical protein